MSTRFGMAMAVGLLTATVGFGQTPTGGTKPTTTGTTTTTGTSTGGTGTTGTATGTDLTRQLIQAEMDELNGFLDLLIDEFGLTLANEEEAQYFVTAATQFYFWSKAQAAQQQRAGPRRR